MQSGPATDERLEPKPDSPRGAGPWGLRVVGLGAFIAALLVVMCSQAALAAFLHMPSLLFVVGATAALGMVSFTPPQWLTVWRCLIQPNGQRSCGERRLAAGVFRMMAAYAIATGAVATLIGLVVVLANLENPSQIGPGMAMMLLASLYGALLAILLIVAGTVASSSGDWTVTIASRSMRPVGAAAGAAAGAVGVALLGFMMILWALSSPA